MQRLSRIAFVAAVAVMLVLPLAAAEKTLDGTLVCAKCYLNKPDATECQDVLLVAGADGKTTEYYVTKNEVAAASGEACTLEVKAAVTGEVTEKDGRLWITPSKIEKK
jgi:Family of unknown function (DUF6370)